MGCGNSKTQESKQLQQQIIPRHTKDFLNAPITVQKNELDNYKRLVEETTTNKKVEWVSLQLEETAFFGLVNAINSNSHLESIRIKDVDVSGTHDILIEIAKELIKKKDLKFVELNTLFKLGNKKGKAIAQIMKNCPLLERLIINNIELEAADAKFIGQLLKKYSNNLSYFEITNVYFEDRVQDFLDGLYSNNSIKELLLNRLNLTENPFAFLVKAVTLNECLVTLDVSHNPIKEGVKAFKEFKLKYIKTLKLNNCDIDDLSFSILLDGLKNSETLKILELNINEITENSANDLKLFFDFNCSLTTMYLETNKIRKRDVTILDDSNYTKMVMDS